MHEQQNTRIARRFTSCPAQDKNPYRDFIAFK